MSICRTCLLILIACAALVAVEDVVINEFLARNEGGLSDTDGDRPDWIELHNRGTSAVSLQDWSLTDNAADPAGWALPAIVIPAGGYLVVFASGKDRRPLTGELHTDFKLAGSGEYLGLYRADGSLADAYAPAFPPQSDDISYGRDATATAGFFSEPTPGAANGEALAAPAAPVTFSQERGLVDSGFELSLSSPAAGATIRYTLDGTLPTATSGSVYQAGTPITLSETTAVRAIAVVAGRPASPVVTHTYIIPDSVIRQPANAKGTITPDPRRDWVLDRDRYPRDPGRGWDSTAMDQDVVDAHEQAILDGLRALPSLAITGDPDGLFDQDQGIMANQGKGNWQDIPETHYVDDYLDDPLVNPAGRAWQRAVAFEFIPQDGRATVQIDAGMRMAGNVTAVDTHKSPINILFNSVYGAARLDYPLLPRIDTTSFSDLRLNPVYEWPDLVVATQWMHDQLGLLSDMRNTQNGAYVHLYVNGMYWGVYGVMEMADEEMGAIHHGGDADDWEFARNYDLDHPVSSTSLQQLAELTDLSDPNDYAEAAARLDIDQYIDATVLSAYFGADMKNYQENSYLGSPAAGFGWQIFFWDMERVDGIIDPSAERDFSSDPYASFLDPASDTGPVAWRALCTSAEFRLRYADRLQQHRDDGAFDEARLKAHYDLRHEEILPAVWCDQARWPTNRCAEEVPVQRDDVFEFIDGRTPLLLDFAATAGLYRAAPVLSQAGGLVAAGFSLAISDPANEPEATIYYTQNGGDPRLVGGGVSGDAQAYDGPLTLTRPTRVIARIRSGGDWSAKVEALFTIVGTTVPPLQISELLAHSDPPLADAVEIHNPTDAAVDLTGWWLTDDREEPLRYRIVGGTVPAQGYLTLWADDDGDEATPPPADHFGSAFRFSSDGEEVQLTSPAGIWSDGFAFGASATDVSFGRHTISTDEVHFPAQLGRSLDGADQRNRGPRIPPVIISEIHYDPPDGRPEFVEITNRGEDSVTLGNLHGGWRLNGVALTFAPDHVLGAGQSLVCYRGDVSAADFRSAYGLPADSPLVAYTGSLDNGGERLRLSYPAADASGTGLVDIALESVRFDQLAPWPDADANGHSLQRELPATYADDPIAWTAEPPTPGDHRPASGRRIDITSDALPAAKAAIDGGGYRSLPASFEGLDRSIEHTIDFDQAGEHNG